VSVNASGTSVPSVRAIIILDTFLPVEEATGRWASFQACPAGARNCHRLPWPGRAHTGRRGASHIYIQVDWWPHRTSATQRCQNQKETLPTTHLKEEIEGGCIRALPPAAWTFVNPKETFPRRESSHCPVSSNWTLGRGKCPFPLQRSPREADVQPVVAKTMDGHAGY
jgi:hypothetical protein